jgi:hypothetical protein
MVTMEIVMQECRDGAARAMCGGGALPGACLAGAVTLLLGGVCLAYAFVVPGLFGPVAAAVVAAERMLCAARSSSPKEAAFWTCIAFGWIAVASCMLHAPLVSVRLLQWLVVLLVVSSAVCRLSTGPVAPEPAPISVWFVVAGVAAELAVLLGVTAAPLAIELVMIGVVTLLQAARAPRDDFVSHAASRLSGSANLSAAIIKLDREITRAGQLRRMRFGPLTSIDVERRQRRW